MQAVATAGPIATAVLLDPLGVVGHVVGVALRETLANVRRSVPAPGAGCGLAPERLLRQ